MRAAAQMASGNPSAAEKGRTLTESAPPIPAARAALVVRSMFSCGARRVIIRQDVSA